MKPQDMRNMTKDELDKKVRDLQAELSKLRFQSATGTLEKSASITNMKKDIARINTILREGSYAK